jgi:hypothetical protein
MNRRNDKCVQNCDRKTLGDPGISSKIKLKTGTSDLPSAPDKSMARDSGSIII